MKMFEGVIEDVNDPEQMGRVRVRCFGHHTGDPGEIPTSSLPWATQVMPVTSASLGGIGRSATGLLPGSWVIGYFRDGDEYQDPVVLGSVPSKSTRPAPGKTTFADPSGVHPVRDGVDIPAAADSLRFMKSPAFLKKESLERSDVKIAVKASVSTLDPTAEDEDRGSWAMPKTADTVKPQYPHCHVEQTASGHTFERDDTPGHERISETHCSGTHREIVADGSERVVVVGSHYRVVMQDDNIYVEGNCNLTVKGDVRTLIKGNYHLEVEGDMTENIKGSKKTKIGASELTEVGQEQGINIGEARKVNIGSGDTLSVGSDQKITIGGSRKDTIAGSQEVTVVADQKVAVGSNILTAAAGKLEMSSKGDMALETSSGMGITSADAMDLESGATCTIDASGNASINGAQIHLNEA